MDGNGNPCSGNPGGVPSFLPNSISLLRRSQRKENKEGKKEIKAMILKQAAATENVGLLLLPAAE